MRPVEKMAARLLSRHNLEPPYDLEALAMNYASVEQRIFPFDADGITIGIGGEEIPQILVNSSVPDTRRKFTLAHELGHVIIPWHTGTIVSHLDKIIDNIEYREMETEANQFAAELLIPRDWLLKFEKKFGSVEEFMKFVLSSTGASRDAILIKIFNNIEQPIVCAQLDPGSNIVKAYRTTNAPPCHSIEGKCVDEETIYATADKEERFNLGDRSYITWFFAINGIHESDLRPWREVLKQILDETDSVDLLHRVNAILPASFHPNKGKTEEQLCFLALRAYDGRDDRLKVVIAHRLFPQYVIKRVRELMARNST